MTAILHRHHKGTETSDHTVSIVLIEVLDIEGACRAALEQQGQAVDDVPLGNGLIAGVGDPATLIVRAVTCDVDHLARGVPPAIDPRRNRSHQKWRYAGLCGSEHARVVQRS